MQFSAKSRLFSELENAEYKIQGYRETFNFLKPFTGIWPERIKQLNPAAVTGHIKTLLKLWEHHLKRKSSELRQCTVYAKRLTR